MASNLEKEITMLKQTVSLRDWVDAPARVLMSLLFLISGIGKLAATAKVQAYMQAYGVPPILVYPAAIWEIGAGVLLVVGLCVRPLSILLAIWCILTAAIFHIAWSDQTQMIMFLKNMTMAGGFLIVARASVSSFGFDSKSKK
jgi:putative oxidoreductase